MKCDEIMIKLSGYLDGELSHEERKLAEEHLAGCEGCRAALAELENTVGHIRSVGDVEPPAWFTQRVMQRVREESARKKGFLRELFFPLHVKLPVEALAVALVAVAAIYIFNEIKPEVQMKVATKPVAEAPAPAEPEEGDEVLRDEMRAEAPLEQKASGLSNESEDRAIVLRKSSEPAFRAMEPEAAPEKAHAPPAIGEGVAPAKGGALMDREMALKESLMGRIVFVKEGNIYMLDGLTNKTYQLTTEGLNSQPQWSPDGTKIAFASLREGWREIYVMDSSGKNQKRITNSENGSSFPRWSSDGKSLYYFSNIKGTFVETVVGLRTGEEEIKQEIKKTEGDVIARTRKSFKTYPSPDGKLEAHYYMTKEIHLIDKQSGKITVLGSGSQPAWSYDSSKLAYFISAPGEAGHPWTGLVVYDTEKGQHIEKIQPFNQNCQHCYMPSWSRDGEQLAYVCGGVVAGLGEPWIYIYDFRTRHHMKLLQGSNPDWD